MRLEGESQGFLAGQVATGEAGDRPGQFGWCPAVFPAATLRFPFPDRGRGTGEGRGDSPAGGKGGLNHARRASGHRSKSLLPTSSPQVRMGGGTSKNQLRPGASDRLQRAISDPA